MVKRYVLTSFGVRILMPEAAKDYDVKDRFVNEEDYAALQTVANHYKGEVAALEAECKRLRDTMKTVSKCAACPVCAELAEACEEPT